MKGKLGLFGWLVLFLALGCTQSPSPAALTLTTSTATQSALNTKTPMPAQSLPATTSPPLPSVTPISNGYPPPATVELPEGYVALPTATRTPTKTAGPSPTLRPTVTPEPSNTPTTIPGVEPATIDQLPGITRDLLFLEAGRLKLWNHATSQIELLLGPPDEETVAGNVEDFSVSEQGRNVAAILAGPEYSIALLNLETRQTISLVEETAPPLFVSISPDGQSVAYVAQDPLPGTSSSAQSLAAGGPASGKVFVVRVEAPNEPQEVGYCAEISFAPDFRWGCRGLVWSPDSRSLVVGDGLGIWISDLATPTRLLVSTYIAPPDTPNSLSYVPIAWSPVGRYVLLSVRHYEGSSKAILDTQSGHLADIPSSFEYVGPSSLISWMRDGRLFIVRQGSLGGPDWTGEVLHINPSLPELLSRDSLVDLKLDANDFPGALVQLEDGRLTFARLDAGGTDDLNRGLYVLARDGSTATQLVALPPHWGSRASESSAEINWVPDGSGAIVRDWNANWLMYAAIDIGTLYDLRRIMGETACCFTWTK